MFVLLLACCIFLAGGIVLKMPLLFGLSAVAGVLGVIETTRKIKQLSKQVVVEEQKETPVKSKRTRKFTKSDANLKSLSTKYEYNDIELVPIISDFQVMVLRFEKEILTTKNVLITDEMLDKMEMLFNNVLEHIEICYDLGQTYKTVTGDYKKKIKVDRESTLEQVKVAIKDTITSIEQLVALKQDPSKQELTSLANDINFELEVAMKTREEFRKLGISESQLTRE